MSSAAALLFQKLAGSKAYILLQHRRWVEPWCRGICGTLHG